MQKIDVNLHVEYKHLSGVSWHEIGEELIYSCQTVKGTLTRMDSKNVGMYIPEAYTKQHCPRFLSAFFLTTLSRFTLWLCPTFVIWKAGSGIILRVLGVILSPTWFRWSIWLPVVFSTYSDCSSILSMSEWKNKKYIQSISEAFTGSTVTRIKIPLHKAGTAKLKCSWCLPSTYLHWEVELIIRV